MIWIPRFAPSKPGLVMKNQPYFLIKTHLQGVACPLESVLRILFRSGDDDGFYLKG